MQGGGGQVRRAERERAKAALLDEAAIVRNPISSEIFHTFEILDTTVFPFSHRFLGGCMLSYVLSILLFV